MVKPTKGLYKKRSSFATEEEFFVSRVVRGDGCWLWTGRKTTRSGYGCFRRNGKTIPAHRVSYELFVGPIPPGLEVRHICDNPPCVNPDHLSPGTHKENMEDMAARGRAATAQNGRTGWQTNRPAMLAAARNRGPIPLETCPRGEAHGNHKLTAEQVRAIRKCKGHKPGRQLATEFGVSPSTVFAIWAKRVWKWLPE